MTDDISFLLLKDLNSYFTRVLVEIVVVFLQVSVRVLVTDNSNNRSTCSRKGWHR